MRRSVTPSSILLALLLAPATRAQSQSVTTPVPVAGPNIVRLDALAQLVTNLGHDQQGGQTLLFPFLVSYERRLAASWSINLEGLLNGGMPDYKIVGATLSPRYYLRHDASLSGLYFAPQLAWRRLKRTEVIGSDPNRVVTTGHRRGTGLLVGWQQPFGRRRPKRVIIDSAVGALHWTALGTDDIRSTYPLLYPPDPDEGIRRQGWWFDARVGFGYQF